MFLEALNPQMWAIDLTATPLPRQLLDKGTYLDLKIETQRKFLYIMRAKDYEKSLKMGGGHHQFIG